MIKPICLLLLSIFAPAFIWAQSLVTCPAPAGSLLNDDFTVEVRRPGREWQALPTYLVKVDKVENARHTPQQASMAYFDFSGAVEVSVTYNKGTIQTSRVRPLAAGVTPEVKGNRIRFSLSQPCNLSVEVNGDIFHNLHLFAGAVETVRPNPADTNTIYYGPGIHQVGTVAVPSGKTVYIAGGAIVRGQFLVSHAENVRILGRGILCQYGWKKSARGRGDALTVAFSKNVVIDGITILPEGYTVLTGNAQNVTIRNMRSFSAGGNNDGIDIFCSRDVTIDNVFMRNSDDNIAIYGHRWDYYGNTKDITVRNSVLWADVAHPVLIGTHGDPASPDTLEDMKFINLDILDQAEAQLNYQGCMSINAGDDNLVRHIRFEDIRVEDIREGQLVNIRVMYNRMYNTAPGRGIEDIYFKNVSQKSSRANLSVISGYDSSRSIKNITFENLRINGTLIWDKMPGKPAWYQTGDFAHIYIGEHVEGLRFINTSAQDQGNTFQPLQQKIQSWIDSGYYNGASIIVVKDNKTLYKQFFGSYKPETVVFIASAGKWLAAATIAALVDEGKLHWDDKVKKWLPAFRDEKGEATLAQLLSHTAGYPDYQPNGQPIDIYQSLQASVQHIIHLPPDAPPGTTFKYGGLAMQVAGRMAELATGKDWESIFQEKIARPLGMASTHFTPVDSSGGHAPMLGGGARSTLQDYASFLSMISNNGKFGHRQILSAKAIEAMQAGQVVKAKADKGIYGLGEWRDEIDGNGQATLISSPSWAGAYPWIDKKNNIYGFFLTHIVHPANGFNSFLASPVISQYVREALHTTSFIHPGLLHGREDLERMKKAVAAKEEPIFAGYLQFIQDPCSQSTYKMQGPMDTVGRNPTIGQNVYDNDANAAHQNAIMWYITGEKAYAEKAIEILNAWSSTLKAITGRDAVLMAGLGPFKMVLAAEIIRYTNAGWKAADIRVTERHFRDVIYPVLKDFALFANGNWDAAAIKTVMAIAVFCNDRPMFERALLYYTHGGGNGAIRHYIIDDTGQVQESGRDQGHTQLGIGMLAESCEIAWHQGLDLYGYDDHRLLKGFEYVAKYNLGDKVPFSETLDRTGKYHHTIISARDSGRLRPIFEQVYNHYKQAGIASPYTQQAAGHLRPEGPGKPGADHPGYGTLYYSGCPAQQQDNPLNPPAAIFTSGSPKTIALSWITPVGARSFTIMRSSTPNGPYEVIARNITHPSFTDSNVTPAKTYYYTVSASNTAGESDNAYPAGASAGLPEGWQQQDIGRMPVKGVSSFNGQTFRIESCGNGMGDLADTFHYMYKFLTSDGIITARFVPQPSSQFSSMGLMFRGGVATDAPFVALMICPAKTGEAEAPDWQVRLLERTTAGSALQPLPPAIPLQQPAVTWSRLTGYIWLRLQKKGNACNAFISYNGEDWSPAGSVNINLDKQVLAGTAVASGMKNSTVVSADQVLISLN